MIRFIDLRFQGTMNRFAFWDTVYDKFETISGDQAWETWSDLVESCDVAKVDAKFLARLRGLCPAWVDDPPTFEELDFKEEDPSAT